LKVKFVLRCKRTWKWKFSLRGSFSLFFFQAGREREVMLDYWPATRLFFSLVLLLLLARHHGVVASTNIINNVEAYLIPDAFASVFSCSVPSFFLFFVLFFFCAVVTPRRHDARRRPPDPACQSYKRQRQNDDEEQEGPVGGETARRHGGSRTGRAVGNRPVIGNTSSSTIY
jgi:hypothetical protein